MKALRMAGDKVWPTESQGACHWFLYGLQAKTAIYLFIQLGKYQRKDILWYIKIILSLNSTVHKYSFYWNMTTPIPCLDICHGFCTK